MYKERRARYGLVKIIAEAGRGTGRCVNERRVFGALSPGIVQRTADFGEEGNPSLFFLCGGTPPKENWILCRSKF